MRRRWKVGSIARRLEQVVTAYAIIQCLFWASVVVFAVIFTLVYNGR